MQLNRITQKQLQNEPGRVEGRKGRNASKHSPVFHEHSVTSSKRDAIKVCQVYCCPDAFQFFFDNSFAFFKFKWCNWVLVVDVYLNWNRFSSSFCSETPTLRLKGHFKSAQHLRSHIMNSNKFMPIKRRLLFLNFQSLHRINHLVFVWLSFKRNLLCFLFNALTTENGEILSFHLFLWEKKYILLSNCIKILLGLQLLYLSTNLRDIL